MAYPYVDKKILVIKAYCIRVSDLANADIDRLLAVCFNKHIGNSVLTILDDR